MTLKEIQEQTATLEMMLNKDRYISFKNSVDELTIIESKLPKKFVEKLKVYLNPFSLFPYGRLTSLMHQFEQARVDHNELFIEAEMEECSDFFDTAASFPLDEQQRRAVIADEDNNLVIAGAGSGKTMTIVAKVKYLIEYLDASADTILPISFTHKSAEDMKDRINVRGVNPQTFHKFGLTVLQSVENRMPKIFDETKNKKLFKDFINDLSEDSDYLELLNNFFMMYIKVPKSQFEFESLGDYIQYMKDQNFTTFKRAKYVFRGKETFRNETVKSIEECMIANFLIVNRIEYEYEKQYEYPYSQFGRKKSYKPDFTITTPDGKVYLEHLGMNRNGDVPAFFAGPNESHYEATRRYQKMLEWKQRIHRQNGTELIESYSYQFQEGNLIDLLTQNLEEVGVELDPMTPEEVWELIQESGKDQVDEFIALVLTFLSLLKSNGYTVDDARQANIESGVDEFMKERADRFIDLFEPLFELYEDNLKECGEIDFNDMITKATEYIKDGDYFCPLSYVIIDEFQDLSYGRYRILDAIRAQNPDVKFYCVGDDWQSIYRFAGSDITLFSKFEEYFGKTYTSRIETTYRFNEPLISLSSEFILKNPHQLPKSLQSVEGKAETHYTILESDSPIGDDTEALVDAINELVENGLTPDSTVYIIGRYNFDINRIQNSTKSFTISFSNGLIKYNFPKGKFKGQTLNMHFVTAHKSKGLEADYTILINCNSGKYGFPSGKADDPILSLLLSSADQFENGEERRLFYVAMTRAKKHVIFLTDQYRKSKFIKEITEETEDSNANLCPRCHNGELTKRSGPGYLFYGCSNWAYGCTFTTSSPPVSQTPEPESPLVSEETATDDNLVNNLPSAESETSLKPANAERSVLTNSQRNRLEYFCKNPKLYSGSDKAREKAIYLKSISGKFNTKEKTDFDKAWLKWNEYL